MRRGRTSGCTPWAMAPLLAACAAVSPDDVPPAAAARFAPGVAEHWPGAAAILAGFDLRGERQLRHGDTVLYGIELVRGDVVTHHLLRIRVQRGKPANDLGTLTFRGGGDEPGPRIPDRIVRQVELEFTLFDGRGEELLRSRCEPTPDYFLEESFVAGIVAAQSGDDRTHGIAEARLLQIVRLLQQDPILKRLLGEVASVPFDLRLLFRRDVTLVPGFAKGAAVAAGEEDPFAGRLGPRFDLPFDLLLNGSALVRLSATVTDPRGPTGAAAGIVLLRAQQATDPQRQLRLQLLACARGERTDWQMHHLLTAAGAVDEGVALAFSPDGRWLATPGTRGAVELRDLASTDPTVPVVLLGAADAVGALAFLDASTLLVGRGARIEVFDVATAPAGASVRPAAVVPTQRPVRAIEVATARTCFVGLPAGEVERWTFAGPLAPPAIETVRAPVVVEARIADAPPMPFHELPPPGFLVAGHDVDRVVVAWRGVDFEYLRDGDGRWSAAELPPLPKGGGRAARWRRDGVCTSDRIHHGAGWVDGGERGAKCFGGNVLLVAGAGAARFVGRGHPDRDAVVHGLDPSGRFWVFVAPGYRVLVDIAPGQ